MNGITAVGETIVIISGGFDLSIGSIAAMAGVGSAAVVENGGTLLGSILTALAIGAFIGLVNGAITGYGRINPFITTLGTLAIVRGVAFVLTNNRQVTVSHEGFQNLGKDTVGGMPYSVLILLLTFIFFGFIVPRYRFGRYMYAIGSNERAAALAGVRINRWKLIFFGVSGMLAGLTGFVNAFQLATGIPSGTTGIELEVITAVILGGASLYGGRGRLLGTFLGLMFLSTLLNGLILSGVSPFYQKIASGSSLILAVLFDEWRRRRLARG
ncbi:MAG: ABC transporter permease [Acidimicrobiia bacterium]|nr:ABC transporter permease [Acidimicrobiia bacterium]